MRLRYNRSGKLWVVGFGVHEPKQITNIEDELFAKKMLATKYFDEVKEIKKKIKIKIKKSKKKGDYGETISKRSMVKK